MDHSVAPVLDALREYRAGGFVPFTPPGHKQGAGADPRVLDAVGADVFRSDVISLNGLDDRTNSKKVLPRAQELMADAVGAEHAFFSTCGSSLSVKSAMLAVAGPGEQLLVARQAHKSVIAGLILAGIEPVWVHPTWDAERHLSHPPGVDVVATALRENPRAKGMLLVTPTDYGTCADIRAVARACHAADVPLVVDEAWGAHLPFHDALPQWAMNAEGDVCVTSVHKMGAGVEQSSVFHLQGDRVDPTVLKAREDLLGTTSATSLVYATLDGWRRQMVEHGKQLLGDLLDLVIGVRAAIDGIPGLTVMGKREFPGVYEFDPLKVVVDVSAAGISGYQAADWLRAHQRVTVGLSDHRRIVAGFTVADSAHSAQRLVDALTELARATLPAPSTVDLPEPADLEPEVAMLPRDAFFGPFEQVPVERAAGRVAAEMVTPYPPGAPALVPGEVITQPLLDYLRSGLVAGMQIPDPADPTLDTLRVVARR